REHAHHAALRRRALARQNSPHSFQRFSNHASAPQAVEVEVVTCSKFPPAPAPLRSRVRFSRRPYREPAHRGQRFLAAALTTPVPARRDARRAARRARNGLTYLGLRPEL